MTAGAEPRGRLGAVVLALASAAGFWAGWSLDLVPHSALVSVLGAGLIAAALLVLIGREAPGLQGLAAILLGLCPPATLMLVLLTSGDLAEAAGNLRLWPLILAQFAALLALSLMPGTSSRAAFVRGGFLLSAILTTAALAGFSETADRWVLQSPVHLAIAFTCCLVLAAQGASVVTGPPDADEARLIAGMTQLLPLLGFAGTVWGIMLALEALPEIFATNDPSIDALQNLLGGLGTAFETTLLGLASALVIGLVGLLLPEGGEKR